MAFDLLENTLLRPSVESFDINSSLSYVSSGISIKTPDAIVKFLKKCNKEISHRRKLVREHASSSSHSVVCEIASEVTFEQGQGWLIPGIDDEFSLDQTVSFMTV